MQVVGGDEAFGCRCGGDDDVGGSGAAPDRQPGADGRLVRDRSRAVSGGGYRPGRVWPGEHLPGPQTRRVHRVVPVGTMPDGPGEAHRGVVMNSRALARAGPVKGPGTGRGSGRVSTHSAPTHHLPPAAPRLPPSASLFIQDVDRLPVEPNLSRAFLLGEMVVEPPVLLLQRPVGEHQLQGHVEVENPSGDDEAGDPRRK